jgi:hypothetical protein
MGIEDCVDLEEIDLKLYDLPVGVRSEVDEDIVIEQVCRPSSQVFPHSLPRDFAAFAFAEQRWPSFCCG